MYIKCSLLCVGGRILTKEAFLIIAGCLLLAVTIDPINSLKIVLSGLYSQPESTCFTWVVSLELHHQLELYVGWSVFCYLRILSAIKPLICVLK